ncbi:MAG: hypothetical protein II926_06640 [Bacteroidales bacterium]|nr:hypothetical protein [Bacteroidales bacterium]
MEPLYSSEVALEQAQTSDSSTKCLDTLKTMHDTALNVETTCVTVNGEIAEVPKRLYNRYGYEEPRIGGGLAYQKNDNYLSLWLAAGLDFSLYSRKSLLGVSFDFSGGTANRDMYKKGRCTINENDTIQIFSWKVYYGYNTFLYKNFLFTPYFGVGLSWISKQHASHTSIYCPLMEVGCNFDWFTKTSLSATLKPYYSVLYNKSLGGMPIIGIALSFKAD